MIVHEYTLYMSFHVFLCVSMSRHVFFCVVNCCATNDYAPDSFCLPLTLLEIFGSAQLFGMAGGGEAAVGVSEEFAPGAPSEVAPQASG
jgi:hypothetical protein